MSEAIDRLFALTGKIMEEGVSLVPRVVPPDVPFVQYRHYPKGDCIAPGNKSRWFYHAHKPEEREEGEHGHFHMFLPLDMFKGVEPLVKPEHKKNKKGKFPAKVVHFAALGFHTDGIPLYWFTTNYWVTFEYMMPADAIAERLKNFNMKDAPGDPLVNDWLTAAVEVFHDPIIDLLQQRDKVLAEGNYTDKSAEITSRMDFDL
ncbi:MAG: hypothetical protein AAGH53_00675 [Pseudomonadota bacterium]